MASETEIKVTTLDEMWKEELESMLSDATPEEIVTALEGLEESHKAAVFELLYQKHFHQE